MNIVSYTSKRYKKTADLYTAALSAVEKFPGYSIFAVSNFRISFIKFSPLTRFYSFINFDVSDDNQFNGKPYGEFRRHYKYLDTNKLINQKETKKKQLRLNFGI